MDTRKDILAVNDYVSIVGRARRSKKTGKFGKQRISIEIKAEPVLMDLSNQTVNKAVAERQAQLIKRKLEQGGPALKPASQSARKVSEHAYASGRKWAKKRFSGGRLGETPPRSGERNMFKHSGRMAHVTARFVKRNNSWIVNVPANRLNQATFGTEAEFKNFLAKFLRFVPLADAKQYVKSSEYHRSMDAWVDRCVQVIGKNKSLKAARRQAILGAARALRGFVV